MRIIDLFLSQNILSQVFILADIFIVGTAFRMLFRIGLNKYVSLVSHSYSSHPAQSQKKIMIIGDSTGFGTGAYRAKESISGLLARDLPMVTIDNVSVNGFRTRDLISVLQKKKDERYDLVLISIGGNDVWHLSAFGRLEKDIAEVLDLANHISSNRTIFLIYSIIGFAPFFPKIIRGFLGRRALKIREIFLRVAQGKNIACVDIYDQFRFFEKNPKKYFAVDMIHPSSKGYSLWYREIWDQLTIGDTCPWTKREEK